MNQRAWMFIVGLILFVLGLIAFGLSITETVHSLLLGVAGAIGMGFGFLFMVIFEND